MPKRERSDTERLDWYMRQRWGLLVRDGNKWLWAVPFVRCLGPYSDPRAAIDAAMDAEES